MLQLLRQHVPKRSQGRDRQFFAALPEFSEDFANAVIERFATHQAALRSSRRHARMRRSWRAYYSLTTNGQWDDTEIGVGGDYGELTVIRPNHFRNLLQHQLSLVSQTPPGFETIAINSDSESMMQAVLGNGILDYYVKTLHLDDLRIKQAEIALLLGEAFRFGRWDFNRGRKYAVRDVPQADGTIKQQPVFEGDLGFDVATPYEVAYDSNSPDLNRPRWVIRLEAAHRFDLAAQFPEYEDDILDLAPYSTVAKDWDYCASEYEHDDYCAVYRVYAEHSASQPDGREALVIASETPRVLLDGELTEERIPCFRLAPSDILFRPGGYTNNFDLLPLQDAYAAEITTIQSNHTTFGNQNVAAPQGSNVKPHHLGRGFNLIEYPAGSQPPTPLNFLQTPPEVFTYLDVLERLLETFAVVPAVNRGNADATKGDSGAKDALLSSTATQFASGFFRQLSRVDEDAATFLLSSLRRHATTERVATVAGKYNAYASREFTSTDLNKISRVVVQSANPVRNTWQGRIQLADKLMAIPGAITSAEQYLQVVTTGRLEPMYENTLAQVMLIRSENEQLRDLKAPEPIVSPTDKHAMHFAEHDSVMADPDVRRNPELVARWTRHQKAHEAALTPGSPTFAGFGVLALSNQQPLPGAPPPPEHGQLGSAPPGSPPPANDNGQPQPAPGMPRMPAMPTNPKTGEQVPEPEPGRPAPIGTLQ